MATNPTSGQVPNAKATQPRQQRRGPRRPQRTAEVLALEQPTQTVEARATLKQPDDFTAAEWNGLLRRTGALKGWRADERWAPYVAFTVLDEHLPDIYQMANSMAEGDLSRKEARAGLSSASSAVDRGGHASGGGGTTGAQGSLDIAVGKQTGMQAASVSSGQREQVSNKGHYKGLTLFLWKDSMALSASCKDFFARLSMDSLDAALEEFESTFGNTSYRSVDVGVSGEKISATRQDDTSETLDEDKSRTYAVEPLPEKEKSSSMFYATCYLAGHHTTLCSTAYWSCGTSGNQLGAVSGPLWAILSVSATRGSHLAQLSSAQHASCRHQGAKSEPSSHGTVRLLLANSRSPTPADTRRSWIDPETLQSFDNQGRNDTDKFARWVELWSIRLAHVSGRQ